MTTRPFSLIIVSRSRYDAPLGGWRPDPCPFITTSGFRCSASLRGLRPNEFFVGFKSIRVTIFYVGLPKPNATLLLYPGLGPAMLRRLRRETSSQHRQSYGINEIKFINTGRSIFIRISGYKQIQALTYKPRLINITSKSASTAVECIGTIGFPRQINQLILHSTAVAFPIVSFSHRIT